MIHTFVNSLINGVRVKIEKKAIAIKMLLVGQSDISVDIAQCQIQPPQLWTFHYKHTRCMVVNLRKSLTSTVYKMLIELCGLSASMAMQLTNWINQMYSLSIHSMHHNWVAYKCIVPLLSRMTLVKPSQLWSHQCAGVMSILSDIMIQ